jgi:hypothetical protein
MEAIKGAIILSILERLFLTRAANWLEVRRGRGVGQLHACLAQQAATDAALRWVARLPRFQEHIDYYSLQVSCDVHAC